MPNEYWDYFKKTGLGGVGSAIWSSVRPKTIGRYFPVGLAGLTGGTDAAREVYNRQGLGSFSRPGDFEAAQVRMAQNVPPQIPPIGTRPTPAVPAAPTPALKGISTGQSNLPLGPGMVSIPELGGAPIPASRAIGRLESLRGPSEFQAGYAATPELTQRYRAFDEATRRNAVRYGLSPGRTIDEQVASLTAKLERTKDTGKQRAIQQQIANVLRPGQEANRLEMAKIQAQGEAAPYNAKIQQAIISGQYDVLGKQMDAANADTKQRMGVLGSIGRGIFGNENLTPDEQIQQFDKARQFIVGGQGAGGVAATQSPVDANKNGVPDELESDYNRAVIERDKNKEQWQRTNPAALTKAENTIKMLKAEIEKRQKASMSVG